MSTIYDDDSPLKVLLIGKPCLQLVADLPDASVTTAQSLVRGIDKAKKILPDVAVLSLDCVDFKGMEALAQFRDQVPEIPVVAVCRTDAEAHDALQLAVDAFGCVLVDVRARIEAAAKQIVQAHSSFRSILADMRREIEQKAEHDSRTFVMRKGVLLAGA